MDFYIVFHNLSFLLIQEDDNMFALINADFTRYWSSTWRRKPVTVNESEMLGHIYTVVHVYNNMEFL